MTSAVQIERRDLSDSLLELLGPSFLTNANKDDLNHFLELAAADKTAPTPEPAISKLSELLMLHNQSIDLKELNTFFKAVGSVTTALNFLLDLTNSSKEFSLQDDLPAISAVFSAKRGTGSIMHALSISMENFVDTPVADVASILERLLKADDCKSIIVLSAFNHAAKYLTDIQTQHLLELGIQARQDAGEFFIQFAAALPQISAHELLITCANSDIRLVDQLRNMTKEKVVSESEPILLSEAA